MSAIPSLRADFEEKRDAYADARKNALESIEYLRTMQQKAYTKLAAACRAEGRYDE